MIAEVSKIPLIMNGVSLPALMCKACFIDPRGAVDSFLCRLRQTLDSFHEGANGILLRHRFEGVKHSQTLMYHSLNCRVTLSASFSYMSEQDMEWPFEADAGRPVRVGKEP